MTAAAGSTGVSEFSVWRPALWVQNLAAKPAKTWSLGRSVRAVIAMSTPLLVGLLIKKVDVTMWASMGALLLVVTERDVFYKARFHQIAVTLPFVAAAFMFGFLASAPPLIVTAVMTVVSFLLAVASGYTHLLSIASMQVMLISTLVLGTSAASPFWPAALVFIAGGLFYCFLLGLEALIYRSRPDRVELQNLLRALADLAAAQATENGDLSKYKHRAIDALNQFDAVELARRCTAQGSTPAYAKAAHIARAADEVLARLLAQNIEANTAKQVAARLRECAAAVRNKTVPDRSPLQGFVRLQMLEEAIWEGKPQQVNELIKTKERFQIKAPGRDLLMTAARFALCMMVAYLIFEFASLQHGYWVPLTVAIVMKPDMGSVFARAVLRTLGTSAGALIALLLTPVITKNVWLVAVLAVLAFILPWAMSINYALQMVVLTPLIMSLLKLVDPAQKIGELDLDRVVATLIGGLIVVVLGYAIWPQSRHPNTAAKFSVAIAKLADYAAAVTKNRGDAMVAAARRASYQSLSDIRVAIQRTLSEPPPAGAEAAAWVPVLGDLDRIADRITDASMSFNELEHKPDAAILDQLAGLIAQISHHSTEADLEAVGRQISLLTEQISDPSVRELTDDVRHLQKMLAKPHPASGHRFRAVT